VTPPRRPLRADAARNRSVVGGGCGRVAERVLMPSGATSLAGPELGRGTVFRHFATKDDLIARSWLPTGSIAQHRRTTLARMRRSVSRCWSSDCRRRPATATRPVIPARRQRSNPKVTELRAHLFLTIDSLVDRCARHGAVRPDITERMSSCLSFAPNYVVGYLPNAAPDALQHTSPSSRRPPPRRRPPTPQPPTNSALTDTQPHHCHRHARRRHSENALICR